MEGCSANLFLEALLEEGIVRIGGKRSHLVGQQRDLKRFIEVEVVEVRGRE